MFLLDAVSPMQALTHELTQGPLLAVVAALVGAGIAIAAFFIASSPKCAGLMGLVSCAWGAFGAAFGPVILLALFWKRMTYWGALAGIVVGFAVDAVWYAFMGWTMVYEIIPGFIAGLIAALVVSLLTAKPGADVIALYEKSRQPQETAADAE